MYMDIYICMFLPLLVHLFFFAMLSFNEYWLPTYTACVGYLLK